MMNRWMNWMKQAGPAPRRNRRTQRARLGVELLEDRSLLSASPYQHVLLLSVDGLHAADVSDPSLAPDLTNILNVQNSGVTYTNASTTSPSDSFPGTLSYLTGAHPGTTGVFYDDSYSRTLLAPGSTSAATPGTEVALFENLDKNSNLLSGGGNFDASSINPNNLPIDPTTNQVVYPNQFLQVNTIFDVAHQAGLYTAFSDKHPAYQIADGNNPQAINDFYGPEINSFTALFDPSTGQTVNADTLLNRNAKPVVGLNVAAGYTVKSFAVNPTSLPPGTTSTQPDSIAVDGLNIFVDYAGGVAKDGSDGKSSTIVQYDTAGNIIQTFSVLGHNDGLKVDPSTHLLWALQNEDANPSLVIIDPTTGTTQRFVLSSVDHGGGFDDITFLGGNVYLTASNPSNNPNTDPAVVQITISGGTATLTPILMGNATATNTATGQTETLNLQDPDSMTADNAGNLVFTSQADDEIVTIHNPGPSQTVTVTHIVDKANNPVSVDDTLFTSGSAGEVLVTDLNNGAIYQVTLPAGSSNLVLSAARDIGQVGLLDTSTGVFTPVISGLGSPRGLAFVNAGPFADLSKYTLVDASTDPIAVDPTTHLSNDPNIQDTTTNFLLIERYDDLKVQAILNEIKGLPSHTFFNSNLSQIPALFGMNFQAVSVAEKDALGGIQLLPNGQEGAPSTFLQAALEHTDASIGRMVQALKAQGIWDSTLLVVTAKHGQDPRVGQGGLMHAGTLTNLLSSAGIGVAQTTEDDVSLLWLQNQKQTAAAVKVLKDFQQTGTLDVFFQGVPQQLPASQVIDKILFGQLLVNAQLGNPATDSTTPDIIVTLKPGFIWVGNVNSQHKNAEHGGFSPDDTHIALIVGSGGLRNSLKGTVVTTPVQTTQIAVTALQALGLDPRQLQGAVIEDTQDLPGLGLTKGHHHRSGDNHHHRDDGAATTPGNDSDGSQDLVDIINWEDRQQSAGRLVPVSPHGNAIKGDHLLGEGAFVASPGLTQVKSHAGTLAGFQNTVAASQNEQDASWADQIDDGFWTKVASLKN
jgi:arylsulfatase A-like enzyme